MEIWAAWVPSIITVLAVIYAAGAIVGRIKDQEITISQHNDWLKSHDAHLSKYDTEIAVNVAFRNGYQEGKASAHGRSNG